jgi:hypothetical protein
LGEAMSVEIVAGFVGVIATVVVSSVSLAYWLGKKFSEINYRFRLIDERFKVIDDRFKQIGKEFGVIEERLGCIEKRLEGVEQRIAFLERRFNAFGEYSKAIYLTLVDFMTLKKLFTDDERRFLERTK